MMLPDLLSAGDGYPAKIFRLLPRSILISRAGSGRNPPLVDIFQLDGDD
jgi:hypothetical protein